MADNSISMGGDSGDDESEWRESLDWTVIAIPLFEEMKAHADDPAHVYDVIVDLNLTFEQGRENAAGRAEKLVDEAIAQEPEPILTDSAAPRARIMREASRWTPQYLFARLTADQIRYVTDHDDPATSGLRKRAIHKIWLDHDINPLLTSSVSTVKADAARVAFGAVGSGIVWAVVDSGIQGDHPHFWTHKNLALEEVVAADGGGEPLMDHQDLSGGTEPLVDRFGHGTHVAGIIAGGFDWDNPPEDGGPLVETPLRAYVKERDSHNEVRPRSREFERIFGVAPQCKLLSLKVLDDQGKGKVSSIIAALGYVQHVNEYGRWLHIHGVNLSVGYEYDAEWFACGQSPLCVEVDRLVRSGVVVVVAAGNTGYGFTKSEAKGTVRAGIDVTINDPGNADAAITVGSTHREKPHIYGVSYFSSKGPTGDGRLKPDLVAPGEKVISCAAGRLRDEMIEHAAALGLPLEQFQYVESSGTSMAAPHVSGVIAAFLSIRREFIGQADRVKEIFLATATDLKRERYFQGQGLVDLMRAIQSV